MGLSIADRLRLHAAGYTRADIDQMLADEAAAPEPTPVPTPDPAPEHTELAQLRAEVEQLRAQMIKNNINTPDPGAPADPPQRTVEDVWKKIYGEPDTNK